LLDALGPEGVLVNVACGTIVDEPALVSDHFEMPLVLPVPAADIAVIKANNDGFALPRRQRRVP
jgi:hypothetical protein